jgi:hypothetical protein
MCFTSDDTSLVHVCATYLPSPLATAAAQQPWANLGFYGSVPPLKSVFGCPSPILNIIIC